MCSITIHSFSQVRATVGNRKRHAGATLLTRDRSAIPVYETIGVAYELVD